MGQKKTTKRRPIKKKMPKDYLLDSMFSRYIKWRDGNKCKYCGDTEKVMNCAHYIGRRKYQVRWEPDNACCCCVECHFDIDARSKQKEKLFTKLIGTDRMEELDRLSRIIKKIDREAIKERLTKLLEGIE